MPQPTAKKVIKLTKDAKLKDNDSPIAKAGEGIISPEVWDELAKAKGSEKKLIAALKKEDKRNAKV